MVKNFLNTKKFSFLEKYSRGRRGAPAKGVGRATGARVQIPLSPLYVFYALQVVEKISTAIFFAFIRNAPWSWLNTEIIDALEREEISVNKYALLWILCSLDMHKIM